MKENDNSIILDRSPSPDLMTEQELVQFLRIPHVTTSKDHHNVIKNLIRMRDLPRIKLCGRRLFPRQAVLEWIEKETTKNKR